MSVSELAANVSTNALDLREQESSSGVVASPGGNENAGNGGTNVGGPPGT